METQDKIQSWKNTMIESAKNIYNQDKELMPVAMLYTGEKETIIIGMPFSSQKEKEMCSIKLKELVREHKAIAVLFIHEGYMMSFKGKNVDKLKEEYEMGRKSIKDMDGRIETVIIVFETKSGEKELTTIEIENKKLGEEKTIKSGQSEGLFSNFFATPVWIN